MRSRSVKTVQVVNLFKTAVVKAETDCIAPALEPQKPSAEVLMEQEGKGVTVSYYMQTLTYISVLSQTYPVFQCYFATLCPWSSSLLPPREVDVAWRQQPRCVMQALTFPTNAFLHSPRDICWPWRALKQCGFPGPRCGFSSYRKIYSRIFVFQWIFFPQC